MITEGIVGIASVGLAYAIWKVKYFIMFKIRFRLKFANNLGTWKLVWILICSRLEWSE
jgi:hypothetical protein